ncbi:sodium/calcium exchanger NCL1-like [Cynara cardunculus var. scolymus]|uniref:sodium/calcium exchanger NCL1-like n=1 Tax=Cynara cardunculus var. scolymus TaxID=59895 RepID=UPI000D630F0A|nr:sodium/calcium exchanger NCL1-like [Cynara cardunculus var. scolymus]
MNMRKLLLAASRDVTTCYYTFLILSLLAVNVAGRYLHDNTRELDVDGISGHTQPEQSSFLRLKGMDYSEEYYCSEQMYGFLPCSSTLVGHFFLIVVYEYLLFQGESLVISGGSRLFEILGPGVFGASAFPVLDPLPESLIVLVSGLVASKEEAQEYVKTGVGLLTGSTIFLLTLLWGTCVIVGSQKFHSNPIQSRQSSLPWSGSGVITDVETSETARIMLVSLVPFIIILIPKIFDVSNSSGGYKIYILIALIFSAIIFLAHVYKMSDEQVQVRRLRYIEVEHELLVFDMLQRMQEHISKPLVTEGGAPNEVAIRRVFESIDEGHDNSISLSELRNKFMAFNLADMKLDEGDAAEKIMNHFDKNKNGELDVEEFIAGIKQWHNLPINLAPTSRKHPNEGRQMMMNEVDKSLSARAIATMLLVLGITILVLLVEPLIQSVQKFSASAGIPSFYVAFILVPLATNARTTISAIRAVSQKKQMPFKKSHNEQTTISLTFSEIYHGVLMNNILGMLVLSSIIYFRGLTWNFSFEVLIVLVVCATMGLLASFRSKFPIWTSFVAYMLYILSLTLVYILNGTLHSS